LEEIRLLGNLQTDQHKLLQILLVGQNELNARLNLPELWQLKQRIAFRLSLNRLDLEGVDAYIRYRWTKAGGREDLPFDELAVGAIAKWSNGIPRVINAICDNSLMLALSESTRAVHVEHVQLVCEDLHLATPAMPRRSEDTEESASMPALVRRAAVGGGAQEVPHRPLAQAPPASRPAAQKSAVVETESWSFARPSLLKKWRGFLDAQKDPHKDEHRQPSANDSPKAGSPRKDSGSLSLKKHL
jgi:general secretion pathway protein A